MGEAIQMCVDIACMLRRTEEMVLHQRFERKGESLCGRQHPGVFAFVNICNERENCLEVLRSFQRDPQGGSANFKHISERES